MGSFKQILVAVICLAAAFAFGNYVNSYPAGGHPQDEIAQENSGNVQSRLTDGIELIEKRPASIATMRNRLQPRFGMPSSESGATSPQDKQQISLPPPSQLSSSDAGSGEIDDSAVKTDFNTQSNPAADLPKLAKQIKQTSNVPDFSTIMDELDSSQVALKPLGQMPHHTTPFGTPSAQTLAPPAKSEMTPPIPEIEKQPSASPWNIKDQPVFTADDFAPELKHGLAKSQESQQPPIEETDNPSLQTIADLGPPPKENHVVSRKPLPTAPNLKTETENAIINVPPPGSPEVAANESIDSQSNSSNGLNRIPTNGVQSRAKLPFSLNDQGKRQLAALRSRADSQLSLNTDKFVQHVVEQGETLQSISTRYFGNPDFYLDIYLANRSQMRNPVDIPTGVSIRIPVYK